MADQVKLYGLGGSPFVCRVKIALKMKGIEYENFEEDLSNKSADLLKYNPVHKNVPVLVHNGNPICESLVIVEYIDDAWKGVPILPHDPFERAVARFWAKFIDNKCLPAVLNAFGSKGDEQLIAEACEQLQTVAKLLCVKMDTVDTCEFESWIRHWLQMLENEVAGRGTKFFGGDNVNLIDIAAAFIAYWLGALEEATDIKFGTKEKFPKITQWANDFVDCEVVKEVLPLRQNLLSYFKKRFGKA